MLQILDKCGFLPDLFHLFDVSFFFNVLLQGGAFHLAQIATRCIVLALYVLPIAPARYKLAIILCFLLNYQLFASLLAFHLLL